GQPKPLAKGNPKLKLCYIIQGLGAHLAKGNPHTFTYVHLHPSLPPSRYVVSGPTWFISVFPLFGLGGSVITLFETYCEHNIMRYEFDG
ncbi:hypothetical protein L208DRAFT_1248087, partial [Tricholoma matsutake]